MFEPVIFMFCLTLHNVEEALWFTEWRMNTVPNSRRSPKKQNFIFAVLGITILGYLATGLHILYPDNTIIEFCYIGFVGSMLVNAIVPHLLLTLRYKKYCPGVLTGCFLLIPFNTIILYNAISSHLKTSEVLLSSIIVGVLLLVSIQVLETIAKHSLNEFS